MKIKVKLKLPSNQYFFVRGMNISFSSVLYCILLKEFYYTVLLCFKSRAPGPPGVLQGFPGHPQQNEESFHFSFISTSQHN